eukprot:CAMPEP_0179470290 /NCGR_PEP_ID=MMETSP0799-20121207/50755_1 /TAXON_ID=46947 /ORGANISM="Geminigera cryophila, Strain CCMP2564" /LENGTH=65 /DNA_ID=CAMNT_0021277223 /DNA_START=678 /DNA_END=871 /DNA_ORIENTATION=-
MKSSPSRSRYVVCASLRLSPVLRPACGGTAFPDADAAHPIATRTQKSMGDPSQTCILLPCIRPLV